MMRAADPPDRCGCAGLTCGHRRAAARCGGPRRASWSSPCCACRRSSSRTGTRTRRATSAWPGRCCAAGCCTARSGTTSRPCSRGRSPPRCASSGRARSGLHAAHLPHRVHRPRRRGVRGHAHARARGAPASPRCSCAVALGLPVIDAELALPESLLIAPVTWAGALLLVRIDPRRAVGASRRLPVWPFVVGALVAAGIAYQQTVVAEAAAFAIIIAVSPRTRWRDLVAYLGTVVVITAAWVSVAIATAGRQQGGVRAGRLLHPLHALGAAVDDGGVVLHIAAVAGAAVLLCAGAFVCRRLRTATWARAGVGGGGPAGGGDGGPAVRALPDGGRRARVPGGRGHPAAAPAAPPGPWRRAAAGARRGGAGDGCRAGQGHRPGLGAGGRAVAGAELQPDADPVLRRRGARRHPGRRQRLGRAVRLPRPRRRGGGVVDLSPRLLRARRRWCGRPTRGCTRSPTSPC